MHAWIIHCALPDGPAVKNPILAAKRYGFWPLGLKIPLRPQGIYSEKHKFPDLGFYISWFSTEWECEYIHCPGAYPAELAICPVSLHPSHSQDCTLKLFCPEGQDLRCRLRIKQLPQNWYWSEANFHLWMQVPSLTMNKGMPVVQLCSTLVVWVDAAIELSVHWIYKNTEHTWSSPGPSDQGSNLVTSLCISCIAGLYWSLWI